MTAFQDEKKRIDALILTEFLRSEGKITHRYRSVSELLTEQGYKVSASRVQQVIDKAKKGGLL